MGKTYIAIKHNNSAIYDKFWKMINLCKISKILSYIVAGIFFISMIGNLIAGKSEANLYLSLSMSIMVVSVFSSERCFLKCDHYNDDKFDFGLTNIEFPTPKIVLSFLLFEIILAPFYILFIISFSIFVRDVFVAINSVPPTIIVEIAIAILIVASIASIVARILIWIAGLMLIDNCKLMKKEWDENPPAFVIAEKERIARENKIEQDKECSTKAKILLEQCGMRFFVQYYEQIKLLPLRDITVEETYSPAEREERLTIAKQIIDKELTVYALRIIIDDYKTILDNTTITNAENILTKLTKEH